MTTLPQNPLSWFKIAPQTRRELDETRLGRQLGSLPAILAGFGACLLPRVVVAVAARFWHRVISAVPVTV
jgi:hypothetical protein